MSESVERPSSLAKLRPKSARLREYKPNFAKVKRKSSQFRAHREVTVPHLDKSACERLIYEKIESALSGSYEERAEFLNQLHKLIVETVPESLNTPEFFELICFKMLLFLKDEYPAIRAMCFRILRLCLFTERNLTFILNNHADIYVVRSLDLCVDNEVERCEALRLIGHMINVYETSILKKLIEDSIAQNTGKKYAFPKSIMQPVIAIALKCINRPRSNPDNNVDRADSEPDDRLGLSCIAMFLEFCIHEPRLIIDMSGTDWIVRILTGNSSVNRSITTLVGRILVQWLDDPAVRNMAQLHLVLEQIFAPLIEFGFFEKNVQSSEKVDKMVESVMVTFSRSFLGILRSWSGLFACAAVGPNSNVIASSPLRLLEYLGLGTVGNANLTHIRDMIVNICCDFMEAPYAAKNFQTWKEAVAFYGSLNVPDVFSNTLKEDFVLAQSDILIGNDPEFAKYVDVLASFRYLAFFVLINAGLPQSLARLIVANPNDPSAIKATLLLSDFLRIAPTVVPSTWRASVLSMPSLFQSACEAVVGSTAATVVHGTFDEETSETYSYVNSENAAIALHRFDTLNRVWIHNMGLEPPYDSNYSLFMEHRALTPQLAQRKPWKTDDGFGAMVKSCWRDDEIMAERASLMFLEALRDVSICQRTDNLDEVVDIIGKILADASPLKGLQSRWTEKKTLVLAAKRAIHLAMKLSPKSTEIDEHLTKFVDDFKEKAYTDQYSVKNLVYMGTMYHFALIGVYTSHQTGMQILEKEGVFQIFLEKMNNTTPTELVKVVVASLDYSLNDGREYLPRTVLQKALTSCNEVSRRWCTRFLGAVAALRLPDFHEWGISFLLRQFGDESVKVVRQTIRTLHQWLPIYSQSVRNLRAAPLSTLGEAGMLLKAYLYMDEGVCRTNHDDVMEAIHAWMTSFNTRYFEGLDEDMRVALLNVKRSHNGEFSRASNERTRFGVRAPAHLLGSLAQHDYGLWLLEDEKVVRQLFIQLTDEKDMATVKGALVALGQIGSAQNGIKLFLPDVVPKIIRLAEEAATLSVRGAAFWALNMMATSGAGAEVLCDYGWESNQHRWAVDKARRKHERNGDEEELRRATLSTPIVPEVSISLEKQPRRVDSPLEKYRSRSSSEGCWSAQKISQESVPKLRRSGSDYGLQYTTSESPTMSEYDSSDNTRSRAMTTESGITSGFSCSLVDDFSGNRRRATTITSQCDDIESRSRSSTIARCLSQGLMVDKSRLEAEGTVADLLRDPHFSSKNRERWRLAPFKTRRFLQVNRNIGDPVRYIFMTRGEEECVAQYRNHLLHDDWLSRHLEAVATLTRPTVKQPVYISALPSEVQVMCGNIFQPKKLFADENDRGAKSGHSKNQRTDAGFSHSSYRCFYCESNTEKWPLPTDVDVAFLRRQVLYEVDMLEVKESAPEKKLISLRAKHQWLFEWPCLYADVLELLDEYRFKPRSRSFLQEIFYGALKL